VAPITKTNWANGQDVGAYYEENFTFSFTTSATGTKTVTSKVMPRKGGATYPGYQETLTTTIKVQ
jgi:hypothetical protein